MNTIYAFALTLLAGLSTVLGAAIGLGTKKMSDKFMSGALGFSAGVMIFVGLSDIFVEAVESLSAVGDGRMGYIYAALSFFGGIGLIAILEKLVPGEEHHHVLSGHSEETHHQEEGMSKAALMRMGLVTTIAISAHNLPEGMAMYLSALQNTGAGISMAIAIAIHNIPGGIAIAVPVYHASGSRRRALLYALASGMVGPLGALLAHLFLAPYLGETLMGVMNGLVAGILVYVAIDELLPASEKYKNHHTTVWGVVLGMAVVALSIAMMGNAHVH